MKKKLITTLISTALLTALFAGCGGNNSNTAPSRDEKKASNTVIVYSPNQPEINNEIVNRFKAKTGLEVQLISGGTGVIFAEGHDAISSKPDSYFENAEKERLKKLKQRQDMVKEKLFYKDKNTIEQAKRQIKNKSRMSVE